MGAATPSVEFFTKDRFDANVNIRNEVLVGAAIPSVEFFTKDHFYRMIMKYWWERPSLRWSSLLKITSRLKHSGKLHKRW